MQSKPLTICLWGGWYGSKNTGDHVLLITNTSLFRMRDPDAEIVLLTANGKYIESEMQKVGVKLIALDKWRQFPKTLYYMKRAELLCVTGGVPIYDHIPHVCVFAFFVFLAKLCRTRIMTLGPSCMALNSRFSRWVYRQIFNAMDLITIREKWSLDHLRSLKINKPIMLNFDPGLAFKTAPRSRVRKILEENQIILGDQPMIGIVVRNLVTRHKERADHYQPFEAHEIDNLVNAIATVADELTQKGRVLFIPMNTEGFDDDRIISRKIIDRMHFRHEAVLIDRRYTAPETMGIVAACELMLVNRFHSLVLAFASNVPFVSIAYEHKSHGICERIGVSQYSLDVKGLKKSQLQTAVADAWKNRTALRRQLAVRCEEMQTMVDHTFNLAVKLGREGRVDISGLENNFY